MAVALQPSSSVAPRLDKPHVLAVAVATVVLKVGQAAPHMALEALGKLEHGRLLDAALEYRFVAIEAGNRLDVLSVRERHPEAGSSVNKVFRDIRSMTALAHRPVEHWHP